MEVDAIRGNYDQMEDRMTHAIGEVGKLIGSQCHALSSQCRAIDTLVGKMDNVVFSIQENDSRDHRNSYVTNQAGAPTCFKCNLQGHMSWQCRSQQPGFYSSDGTTRPVCRNCKRDGHRTENCFQLRQQNSSQDQRIVCHFCGKIGHRQKECRKRLAQQQNGNISWQPNTARVMAVGNNDTRNNSRLKEWGPKRQAQKGKGDTTAYQWTDDGRPVCFNCGVAGHRHRDCKRTHKKARLN